jgi:hypothetical protein
MRLSDQCRILSEYDLGKARYTYVLKANIERHLKE